MTIQNFQKQIEAIYYTRDAEPDFDNGKIGAEAQ